MKNLILFWLVVSISSNMALARKKQNPDQDAAHSSCSRKLVPFAQFDPITHEYQGLTQEGITALKQVRDVLRSRKKLFENEFMKMSTFYHMAEVARMYKSHVLLYGPGGGAKSKFVDWFLDNDVETPFKLLMHQMVPESVLNGGQDFEAAKRGEYEVNIKGSLADHAIAVIDEADQGTPAVFASLFKLLEQNPKVWAGKTIQPAKVETVFFTLNANLNELQQTFVEQGMGPKFQPLMNRLPFKGMVYNWLDKTQRAKLHERVQKKRELLAAAKENPSALKNEIFVEPPKLDESTVRRLAQSMFRLDSYANNIYLNLIEEMRSKTNTEIKESEERHRTSPLDEPFVYFPSADYTTRLDLQIPEIIIDSAFIDFLLSPLADDERIERFTKKKIELNPLSLWRSFLVLTTAGAGDARLVIDKEDKVDIDFDWKIDSSSARDSREKKLIENLQAEQMRFKSTFSQLMQTAKTSMRDRASNAAKTQKGKSTEIESEKDLFANDAFESLLYWSNPKQSSESETE